MTSPRQSGFSAITPWSGAGGSSDTGGGVGRIGGCGGGLIERLLVVAGHRVRAYALELRLELRKVSEIAVHRREQHAADRVELGEAAQRQLPEEGGVDLGPGAADTRGDRVGELLELLLRHRALVRRSHEPAQQLLAVELLAPAVALEHGHGCRLGALVGGEALAAALALAPAAHRCRIGQARVDYAGRGMRAEGAVHTPILLHVVPESCGKYQI